jgi:hypothetical protein
VDLISSTVAIRARSRRESTAGAMATGVVSLRADDDYVTQHYTSDEA